MQAVRWCAGEHSITPLAASRTAELPHKPTLITHSIAVPFLTLNAPCMLAQAGRGERGAPQQRLQLGPRHNRHPAVDGGAAARCAAEGGGASGARGELWPRGWIGVGAPLLWTCMQSVGYRLVVELCLGIPTKTSSAKNQPYDAGPRAPCGVQWAPQGGERGVDVGGGVRMQRLRGRSPSSCPHQPHTYRGHSQVPPHRFKHVL